MAPVEEIVVDCPSPTNEYQTPKFEVITLPGGVFEVVPTVVPAKLLVAQGKFVAFAHKSLAGRTSMDIAFVPVHPPAAVPVMV